MAGGAQYLSVFLQVGVILTEHLGVGDDIAQGLVRYTPPPFPVFDDIGQIESTVATPPDEGNLPLLEHTHQCRTRNPQHVSSLLSRQNRMPRDHAHRHTLTHRFRDPPQNIDHPGGKLNRIVACHKTGTPVLL